MAEIVQAWQQSPQIDPAAIAETYWAIHCQPRNAWTWEVELRPWQENF